MSFVSFDRCRVILQIFCVEKADYNSSDNAKTAEHIRVAIHRRKNVSGFRVSGVSAEHEVCRGSIPPRLLLFPESRFLGQFRSPCIFHREIIHSIDCPGSYSNNKWNEIWLANAFSPGELSA